MRSIAAQSYTRGRLPQCTMGREWLRLRRWLIGERGKRYEHCGEKRSHLVRARSVDEKL